MRIIIETKPLSWNVLARKNHWEYTRIFKELAEATWEAVTREDGRPIASFPVAIKVDCRWKQKRRHDIDSIVFKPILDTIVSMGFLPDDSLAYVASVTFTGKTGCERDEMIVEVL